ncbi:hypothetical protein RJ45_22945 [Photobacterium gaetbulicola]|uniref:Lipoprotein n=1 Tax=Photobacterium gaetbulicola TaxID=1295392 RepID=A0A0B9FWJ7_9GAMM|nr:hypothetical protein [Photobacterium gaetbulicola]KHT60903.1 hypothetical protein RJ45_22945 [Photobacterium gaetbulicola]
MKRLLVAAACITLAACSTVPESYSVLDKPSEQLAAEEAAMVEARVALEAFSPEQTQHIRSARRLPAGILSHRASVTYDILPRGELPGDGHAAYGYVIARSSHPRDVETLRALCLAMSFVLNPDSGSGLPAVFRVPTYWPTVGPAGNGGFCGTAVENYDFSWGRDAAQLLGMGGHGPYLVAWESPFEEVTPLSNKVVIDLGRLNDSQMAEVVSWWQDKAARSPLLWNDGIDFERFRLELNALIDTYGEGILKAFELFSGGSSIAVAARN